MFAKATRLKLRYNVKGGQIAVEDLWELPLTSSVGQVNLNDVAKSLNRILKSEEEIDFVENTTTRKVNSETQLKFDIVREVISVKQEEAKQRSLEKTNAERRQELMAILQEKQKAGDKEMTMEQIQAELAKL